MAACVSKSQSRSQEPMAARGVSAGTLFSASRHVKILVERHQLLGLEDLNTAVSHGGCVMPWSLNLKLSRGTMNLCYACMIFFTV